jgi:DNA-binding LytR/AlgR family response regulator
MLNPLDDIVALEPIAPQTVSTQAGISKPKRLFVIGVPTAQSDALRLYVEVVLPSWVFLKAAALSEQLFDFLLDSKPTAVVVYSDSVSETTIGMLNELSAASKVVILASHVSSNAPMLLSSKASFVAAPYSLARICDAIAGSRPRSEANRVSHQTFSVGSASNSGDSRIAAWESNVLITAKLTEIVFVSNYKSIVLLHMKDGRELMAFSADQMREALNVSQFLQVKQTKFVNPKFVRGVRRKQDGLLSLVLPEPYEDLPMSKANMLTIKHQLLRIQSTH